MTSNKVYFATIKPIGKGNWVGNYNNYIWNITSSSMNITQGDDDPPRDVMCLAIGQ